MQQKKQVEVKVIQSAYESEFMRIVNECLQSGWKISSTSCGFVNSEKYDFCNVYQAILIFDDFVEVK